jgi:hypothetical protein
MRARVCVLAVVVPRLMMVVKERRSFLVSLMGCAVLAMLKEYGKRASLSTNLNYRVIKLGGRRLLAEPALVLVRGDERLDHLRLDEVSVELVELREPKVEAREVRVGRFVRRAPQVAEVLYQDKRFRELSALELRVLCDCS